jgi:hypothetical protein
MGYSRFDGNEEDVMGAMLRFRQIPRGEMMENYPYQMKSLLRKKMIAVNGNFYVITPRGKSAITQQARTGEYWVAPLNPKPFSFGGTGKISRSLAGYVKTGRK